MDNSQVICMYEVKVEQSQVLFVTKLTHNSQLELRLEQEKSPEEFSKRIFQFSLQEVDISLNINSYVKYVKSFHFKG